MSVSRLPREPLSAGEWRLSALQPLGLPCDPRVPEAKRGGVPIPGSPPVPDAWESPLFQLRTVCPAGAPCTVGRGTSQTPGASVFGNCRAAWTREGTSKNAKLLCKPTRPAWGTGPSPRASTRRGAGLGRRALRKVTSLVRPVDGLQSAGRAPQPWVRLPPTACKHVFLPVRRVFGSAVGRAPLFARRVPLCSLGGGGALQGRLFRLLPRSPFQAPCRVRPSDSSRPGHQRGRTRRAASGTLQGRGSERPGRMSGWTPRRGSCGVPGEGGGSRVARLAACKASKGPRWCLWGRITRPFKDVAALRPFPGFLWVPVLGCASA